MLEAITCNTCRSSYIGDPIGQRRECSVCRADRLAEDRFEREMAQRDRRYNSGYSSHSGGTPWEGRISVDEEDRQWDLLRKAVWFSILLAVFLTPLKLVDFSTTLGMITVYCLTVFALFVISVLVLFVTLPFQNRS